MRFLVRIAVVLLTGGVLAGQGAVLPVPANIKVEGLPAIPEAVAAKLAPYGQFRRAQLLSWHPSRRAMLVSTTTGTVPQVHLVDAAGAVPKPLTSLAEGVGGAASYSPVGGDGFLYRKDTGSTETHQLWKSEPGAPATLLTDGKSRNGIPVWSTTSGLIAFDSNRRNGKDRDLYVLDPKDPSTSRMLMEVTGSWFVAAWSPDDRSILAVEMLPGNDTALWRIDVATGKPTPLTPLGNKEASSIWSSAHYAPDGRSIFAVANRGSELPRLWRWRNGTWTPLTGDGDSVEFAAVSPDGATVAVVFDRDASSRLELLDTRTLKLRVRPALPAGQITNVQWHPSRQELGFTFGSVGMQGDVFSVDTGSGALTRWTRSPTGGIDAATLPAPEILRWESFDGKAISAVLYRPPSKFTGPRPVIINVHGGPNDARERPRFQGRSAYFLNEMGIAIIYPNVRGSFGFGRTFEKLDDGRMREHAVQDVGTLLDWIGQQPHLDAKRVMVTGASYGGYLTYAVAARYPGRVRCAFAAAAISNFVTYLENTEPGRQQDRRAEYGDERDADMRAFLTSISPVTLAGRITVPLMIAHGRQDARVPIAQAESMYQAVKAGGVPVWLVVYEDAGHENFPKTQANSDFNFYTWILFAEKYLLN
ncbi:MAG: alpha/beta fold hydrolase [Acidobacteria bacterium]|nr:alpha/beta fold hydrolase [Acidobacteriota bacterium]